MSDYKGSEHPGIKDDDSNHSGGRSFNLRNTYTAETPADSDVKTVASSMIGLGSSAAATSHRQLPPLRQLLPSLGLEQPVLTPLPHHVGLSHNSQQTSHRYHGLPSFFAPPNGYGPCVISGCIAYQLTHLTWLPDMIYQFERPLSMLLQPVYAPVMGSILAVPSAVSCVNHHCGVSVHAEQMFHDATAREQEEQERNMALQRVQAMQNNHDNAMWGRHQGTVVREEHRGDGEIARSGEDGFVGDDETMEEIDDYKVLP
jgi:hypothetical protein